MADAKISALSAITSLAAADQFAVANSGASNSLRADHLPGFTLDYVEITAAVTVTATTDGNSQGTAIIDGNSVSYDGSTIVKIEFYAPYISYNVSNNAILINLYDGTNDLGRLVNMSQITGSNAQTMGAYGVRFLTPSNASHTYHIRGWKTSASGSASVGAAAGGASSYVPAFMRITVA